MTVWLLARRWQLAACGQGDVLLLSRLLYLSKIRWHPVSVAFVRSQRAHAAEARRHPCCWGPLPIKLRVFAHPGLWGGRGGQNPATAV